MILSSPGSILFDFGFAKIYYYGVIMALAVLAGLFVCKTVCKKFYETSDWSVTYSLALGSIISGFLGARIYYVFAAYDYYSKNIGEIFALQHGGMSIHGAILGGIIFACIYLHIKKLPALTYLDILTFGLLTGQIIGRWGNFFNSEAFGLPTFSFLKLYIPQESRPSEFMAFDYFHPTFLYESLLNFILLLILIVAVNKKINTGVITFSYILFYSIIRLFIEQIRLDSVLNLNGIPLAQIVSVIGIVVGFLGLIICLKKHK